MHEARFVRGVSDRNPLFPWIFVDRQLSAPSSRGSSGGRIQDHRSKEGIVISETTRVLRLPNRAACSSECFGTESAVHGTPDRNACSLAHSSSVPVECLHVMLTVTHSRGEKAPRFSTAHDSFSARSHSS